MAQPLQNLALSGVCGKPVDGEHSGPHRHVLVEEADLFGAFDNLAARGPLRLEADNHDAGALAPEVVAQVVLDPPCVGHAAGRDDHRRAAGLVDRHGGLRRLGKAELFQRQGVFAPVQKTSGFRVEVVGVPAKDLRRPNGQGAVHIHGHVPGEPSVLGQEVERIDDLLRPFHGEGGDDHLFPAFVAVPDRLGQFVQAGRFILVVAVSVGRFQKEIIGLRDDAGVLDDQLRRPADVSGEDHLEGGAVFLRLNLDQGCPQDMAGVPEVDFQARQGRKGLFIGADLEQGDRLVHILPGVQRHRAQVPPAKILLAFPLRLHLLNVGAVLEHDLQQVPRGRGRVDLSAETLLDHAGKQSGVIDVGVGDQEKIDLVGAVDIHVPVPFFDLRVALVHAAVHGEAVAAGFQDEARSRDRPRRAHKLDFHRSAPFPFPVRRCTRRCTA